MTKKPIKDIVQEANKNAQDGDAFGVVGHYKKCYKQKYGKEPYVNLHKYKYMAFETLNGYKDYDHVKKIIEYYFTLQKEGHPIEWMFRNFDKLMSAYNDNVKDKELRKQRREELAKIRQEWFNGNA